MNISEDKQRSGTIEIYEHDFAFSSRMAVLALNKMSVDIITNIWEITHRELEQYKEDFGIPPSLIRNSNHSMRQGKIEKNSSDRSQWSEKQNKEISAAAPWECFSWAKNNLDVLIDIVMQDKVFKGAPIIRKAALALLMIDTPPEPQNFKTIVRATQCLLLSVARELGEETKPLFAPLTDEEKKKNQSFGRKKGGEVVGKKLRAAAQIRDFEIQLWALDDRKKNGARGQAKRLMTAHSVKERKAREIIATTFRQK